MSLEQLFSTSELNLVVPDTSLEFPPETSADEWLGRVKIGKVERKQAFFDEQLQSLLLLRIPHPTPDLPADPKSPPVLLLEFLNYLQISLEASYISPSPAPNVQEPTWSSRLSAPPRGQSSLAPPRLASAGLSAPQHPSIFPPATPNPVPATGEQDRQYAASEGVFLAAIIWGSGHADQSRDAFSLLWSEKEKVWVAVYRLALTVSFLKTANFSNPLLCLTTAATLRDKPIATSDKHPLSTFLSTLGVHAPASPTVYQEKKDDRADEVLLDGLEEINLLEGLLAGPDFAKAGADKINVPSIRLGASSRQRLFALPPVLSDTPIQPSPSPMTAVRKVHSTLRKSYRRILPTMSTFQLRMRTVFVPYVLLPGTEGTVTDIDETEKERERREAGSAERTVVLCIEIKNFGGQEVQSGIGFMVESVDIKIAGEGAKTTLVGWGEAGLSADASNSTFPLKLGPFSQVNLLYAVTFLRSPEELDSFSFAKPDAKVRSELRRGVSITVNGKPYTPLTPSPRALLTEPDAITLPTRTFSSVWSTVLDLDANPAPVLDAFDATDPTAGYPTALPEPASPFPMSALGLSSSRMGTPTTAMMYQPHTATEGTPHSSVFAGTRKYPLTPGGYFQSKVFGKNAAAASARTPVRPTSAIPPHLQSLSPLNSGRPTGYFASQGSGAGTMQYLRSPTTFGTPTHAHTMPPPSPAPGIGVFSPGYDESYSAGVQGTTTYDAVPPTPAYPAFPRKSSLPPSPMSQGPIASQSQNNVGPSVEVRRNRASLPATVGNLPALQMQAGQPGTPVPHVPAAYGEQRMINKLMNSGASGENVVVSVGLLPVIERGAVGLESSSAAKMFEVTGEVLGHDKIYPLDTFTLDIFVFNQSTWARRFEVTCPEKRRRRRGGAQTGVYGGGGEGVKKMGYPGVLPMTKRVRIGPLRPSACQSVRMEFLAVSPGVHSIDTLTLTDIETGFSMNLRAVLDVVIHDPND